MRSAAARDGARRRVCSSGILPAFCLWGVCDTTQPARLLWECRSLFILSDNEGLPL